MSAPTLGTPTTNPSAGYVMVSAVLSGAAATFRQVQRADDSGFTTNVVDTGLVPMDSVAIGETVSGIVSLSGCTVGPRYYVRIGVANTEYPTVQWSASTYFYPSLPQTGAGAVSQPSGDSGVQTVDDPFFAYYGDGAHYTLLVHILDSPEVPPSVTALIDGVAVELKQCGFIYGGGASSFFYSAGVDLERGSHSVSVVVVNKWGSTTTTCSDIVAAYDLEETGLRVYSGDAELTATEIQLQDAMLPDLPTLSFVATEYVLGRVTCVVKDRGILIYRFIVQYVDKREDGQYSYRCQGAEYRLLEKEQTLQVQSAPSRDIITKVLGGMTIVHPELLTVVLAEQDWQNIAAGEILNQILVANSCTGHIRNGRLFLCPLDVTDATVGMTLNRADPDTDWSIDADTYGKVRVYYSNRSYPLPTSKLSNKTATLWTGTVADVKAVSGSLLPAPSGAPYCLKATTAISLASQSIPVKAFDRFLMAWNPDSATSITVSLQDDASNKLEFVRTFQGGTGSGIIVAGGSADAIATLIITVPTKYIVYAEGNTTQACSYRMTLMNGTDVVWQSSWTPTSGIDNQLLVDVPSAIYKKLTCTSIVWEFKGLYMVNAGYGVQLSKLDIAEYSEQTIPTGQHDTLISDTRIEGATYPPKGFPQQWVKSSTSTLHRWDFRNDCGPVPPLANENQRYEFTNLTFMVRFQHYDLDLSTPFYDDTWEDAVCGLSVENGHLIATYSFDKILWTPEGGGTYFETPTAGCIAAAIPGTVFCDVVVYETTIDTGTAWLVIPWNWGGTTMNLWDSMDVPIAAMTRTGTPVTIHSIVLTATGTYYIDSPHVLSTDPAPLFVEIGTGDRVLECRTENFVSEAAARAYGKGMFAVIQQGREQYRRQVPIGSGIQVGDVVMADTAHLLIYAVQYKEGVVDIVAGKPIANMLESLKETSRRLDALEQYVTR